MFESQEELAGYVLNAVAQGKQSGFTLIENKKYHGEKQSVVRNTFAHSVSHITISGLGRL
jgi:hypothetical protein